jgi:endonuclease/exonuclease/phosphatase family metal-dependent hydrolase
MFMLPAHVVPEIPQMTHSLRLTAAILVLALAAPAAAEETALRVMSFNVWGAGMNEGKPIDATVAAIRAAGADIVGLQETRLESDPCEPESCPPVGDSIAPALAAALGWHVHDQTAENPALWANAVISRFPITGASANDLGVSIDVGGRTVWIFNIHLDDEPYQPYQAVGIEYGPAPFTTDPRELAGWAERTRGPALDLLFADMEEAGGAAAVFVTGDFNEPSALDWTAEAVAAGAQPVAVEWPATRRLSEAGFTDAYRAAHPDPVAKPAFTWTPMWSTEVDPEDKHDRIDFVFVRGARVVDAAIVGEPGPRSDIVSDPWPADHRAVVAEVRF